MTQSELNTLFDNFLAKNNGKYVSSLGSGTYQCFDLAVAFTNLIGVPHYPNNPSPFPYTNAHQIYDDFSSWQASYFDRIANSATFVPQKGDLCIWAASLNGGAGHVSVATGNGNTSTFQSFDENWKGGDPATLITHNYNSFLGVLRKKVISSGPTPTPQPPMDANTQKHASYFDKIWTARFGATDTNQVTDQDVANYIQWTHDEKNRAVQFDLICKHILGGVDSNKVIAQQIIDKYDAGANTDAIREEGRKAGVQSVKDVVNKLT